eukprot:1018069-Amphidinium_carterae.1
MMQDRAEEMEAIRKHALKEEQDIQAQHGHDLEETGTVQEGLSPKNLDDVDRSPARERQEAQLAAAQSMDAETTNATCAASAKRIPLIAPRGKSNKAKQAAKPMVGIKKRGGE